MTVGHALGGLGWAGANLALARILSPVDFGQFALVLAMAQIGGGLGPLGADGLARRRAIEPTPGLLGQTLATAALVGIAATGIGAAVYGLSAILLVAVLIATLGASAINVAGGDFQGRREFGWALTVSQAQVAALALTVVVTAFDPLGGAPLAVVSYCLAVVLVAGIVWVWLLERRRRPAVPRGAFPWSEALPLVTIQAAGQIMVQLDRLLIPRVLDFPNLALFGVLAAVVASPFRMLALGTGFTMLPRLRAAAGPADRRHILVREAGVIAAVAILAGIMVYAVTPFVVDVLLHGKYEIPPALLAAGLVVGFLRVGDAFAGSAASALGNASELARLSAYNWLSLGCSAAAGAVGARWGLTGLVYGVGVGWLLRGLLSASVAVPYFRTAAKPGK